jgi:tocopherol O-methyltransferase
MSNLNTKIKDFYDASTPLWLNTWGEQMHHGFYGLDGKKKVEHKQARCGLWGRGE